MGLARALRHGCPGCPTGASKMLIIAEILASQHLGQKNNLAGMHREVLNNMRDSFQHRDIVALGGDSFGEACGRDSADNRSNFGDPGVQKFGQLPRALCRHAHRTRHRARDDRPGQLRPNQSTGARSRKDAAPDYRPRSRLPNCGSRSAPASGAPGNPECGRAVVPACRPKT